jgi:hypothetical protein
VEKVKLFCPFRESNLGRPARRYGDWAISAPFIYFNVFKFFTSMTLQCAMISKGEGTPRKLATAISENCYQPELRKLHCRADNNSWKLDCVAVASFVGIPSPKQFQLIYRLLFLESGEALKSCAILWTSSKQHSLAVAVTATRAIAPRSVANAMQSPMPGSWNETIKNVRPLKETPSGNCCSWTRRSAGLHIQTIVGLRPVNILLFRMFSLEA